MRSWYMLLFQFEGIAEQWLAENPFLLAGHPDAAEVQSRLAEPGALTASLGWYRANAASAQPHRRSSPQLPPVTVPVLGIWSSGDPALTERQMTESKQLRRRVVALRKSSRAPATGCSSTPPTRSTACYWSSFSRNLRSSSRRNGCLRGLLDRLRVGGVHAGTATRRTPQRRFLQHQREDDAECRERHCREEHGVQCGVERVQEVVEQRRLDCFNAPSCAGVRWIESPPSCPSCAPVACSDAANRLVKIAPKTATPSDPPIERKKVAVDVATPRSL